MATGLSHDFTKEQLCVCSICLDFYTIPRYLPTCGHTFCEQCLFEYTRKLQQDGSKFQCPVCNKALCGPGDNEVTLDWVQTFPLNSVISRKMEGLPESVKKKLAAGGTEDRRPMCDPCKKGDKSSAGEKYCLECKEVMCATCLPYHGRFKMFENHKLIDVKEMSVGDKRMEFLRSFTACREHVEREIDFYCRSHDMLICAECLTANHNGCSTAEISSQMDAGESDLREEIDKMKSNMKTIKEDLSTLQKKRAENKLSLKEKLKDIRREIETVRDQVAVIMDNIVSHVTNVTKQIEIDSIDRLDGDMSRIESIQRQVEDTSAAFDIIEQSGSDRQKFISAKLVESTYKATEQQIMEENNSLKIIDADLELSDDLSNIAKQKDVTEQVEVNVTEQRSSRETFGVENPTILSRFQHTKRHRRKYRYQ